MVHRDDEPRDLLFGLLALQNGMVTRDQLVAAFGARTASRRPLADLLVEQGALRVEHRPLLEALADAHRKLHGGDTERSLSSLDFNRSTRDSLAASVGPDARATLALVVTGSTVEAGDDHPDLDRTTTFGIPTGQGQRFLVLRPHARGGLGEVFVALDHELNREVALKQILDHHADDPRSRRRFLLEAEVTGGLEHPGIVPVYGLGTYDDGRPYYAMRFVRGDSLKEVIERLHGKEKEAQEPGLRSLEIRKLLRRFVDVCNAIDYAHSRGVIHRDIKPSNVIVGRHGETLVVDWGLAKPLGWADPDLKSGERPLVPSAAGGSSETVPGSMMGTPAFMSPEQARGDLDALGPHSDVYSLGATLYCLLTGEVPFQGEVGGVLRRVQAGDFLMPRQLDPSIDRALEAVCLKAMATRPSDRYASPRALADDIERWTADELVTAWQEPFARQARRWARRNRTAVTGTTVALVAGVLGLAAVLGVQTRAKDDLAHSLERETGANRALGRANLELTRSRAAVQARYDLSVDAIKTFHTGVSEDFLLKQDQFKTLRDRLLTSATDFYGKLGALLGREADLASKRASAQANFEVAELIRKVGRTEEALVAHRVVLARREALAREPEADPEFGVDVGRSLTAIASLLQTTGHSAEAEATYRRAEATLADLSSSEAARATLASCRSQLGLLLSTTGKFADALASYRLARAEQEATAESPGASNEARLALAVTIQRIASLMCDMKNPPEVEAESQKALTVHQQLVDENPTVPEYRDYLVATRMGLIVLLDGMGKLRDAEGEYRKTLSIARALAKDFPAVTDFQARLAKCHTTLGLELAESGKPSAAEAEYRKALEIMRKLADEHPSVTDFRSGLANTHGNLAILLRQSGHSSEAEIQYGKALEIQLKLVDDYPDVLAYRTRLALTYNNFGILLKKVVS